MTNQPSEVPSDVMPDNDADEGLSPEDVQNLPSDVAPEWVD